MVSLNSFISAHFCGSGKVLLTRVNIESAVSNAMVLVFLVEDITSELIVSESHSLHLTFSVHYCEIRLVFLQTRVECPVLMSHHMKSEMVGASECTRAKAAKIRLEGDGTVHDDVEVFHVCPLIQRRWEYIYGMMTVVKGFTCM